METFISTQSSSKKINESTKTRLQQLHSHLPNLRTIEQKNPTHNSRTISRALSNSRLHAIIFDLLLLAVAVCKVCVSFLFHFLLSRIIQMQRYMNGKASIMHVDPLYSTPLLSKNETGKKNTQKCCNTNHTNRLFDSILKHTTVESIFCVAVCCSGLQSILLFVSTLLFDTLAKVTYTQQR